MYRSLQLSPDRVVACSSFAVLEAAIKLPINETCYVDTAAFLVVASSLPPDVPISLSVESGALLWSCGKGQAKGKLATRDITHMPEIKRAKKPGIWEYPEDFPDALRLGALASGQPAMATLGIDGVVIDNRGDEICVYSSDNITLAVAFSGSTRNILPDTLTLSPNAAELLAEILKPDGVIESAAENDRWIYVDPTYTMLINERAPLRVDMRPAFEPYIDNQDIVPLESDRMSAFLRRVTAITENKNDLYVGFGAEDGKLHLSFDGGTASSTEYYIVENDGMPDLAPVPIKASNVAPALAHVDRIALDHAEEHRVLVFHGDKPRFAYIVTARDHKADNQKSKSRRKD